MNSPDPWQPLGNALMDYHHGERATFITVRSSVEKDMDVPVDAFYKEALKFSKLEKKALQACKGRILDVGAGAGAHALWLQNKGMEVTAVEISPKAAQVMKLRGVKNAAVADIFEFKTSMLFDTVLMLMNGIGVSGDLDGLDRLLKVCRDALKPDGQIIFDTTDIAYVEPENRIGATLHPSPPEYYGTVQYQLVYKGKAGRPYYWLFADKETMRQAAAKHGFEMTIIAEDDDHYAARLQRL